MSCRDPRLGRSAILGVGLILFTLGGAGCTENRAESKQAQKRPPVPVAVARVEQKSMPLQIQAIGTVEAYSVVSVRAQVGGELTRVHIKEGQDVRKGDLLFTIDPRTAQATVDQAQANLAKSRVQVQQARATLERDAARVAQARATLARDQAQAANAEVQAKRYTDLLKKDLVSKEQHDQYQTALQALAATVQADQADVRGAEETVRADQAAIGSAEEVVRADEAAVANVKVLLGYTTIRSPLDGRTGSLGLHEGNVVRATGTNDSTLLVINQIQPIYVSFTVPQQQLPAIKRYMAEGTLQVQVLPSGDPKPVRGTVTFVDNTVDSTTGTIRLKATFANEEKRLWPGQFVNVTLTLTTEPNAIVIPAQAVQSGQQGTQYVFVVKQDSTVDNRRVTVERTQGSETVIAKGLTAGEQVVTDGQPRLTPGTKVEVRGAEGRGGRPAGEGAGGGGPRQQGGGERQGGGGAEKQGGAPGQAGPEKAGRQGTQRPAGTQ
jgi:multidrug efflux system membrane fusion protein